jgi:Protein of unknown function (DUF1761)
MDINWLATGVGFVAAFTLSFLWFGPLFGKAWAAGSHGITLPERPPVLALLLYAAGVGCLALVIGATATINALGTALAAIGAAAVLVTSSSLFSQKTLAAALIDGGCILVMGAVMIAAQGLL